MEIEISTHTVGYPCCYPWVRILLTWVQVVTRVACWAIIVNAVFGKPVMQGTDVQPTHSRRQLPFFSKGTLLIETSQVWYFDWPEFRPKKSVFAADFWFQAHQSQFSQKFLHVFFTASSHSIGSSVKFRSTHISKAISREHAVTWWSSDFPAFKLFRDHHVGDLAIGIYSTSRLAQYIQFTTVFPENPLSAKCRILAVRILHHQMVAWQFVDHRLIDNQLVE